MKRLFGEVEREPDTGAIILGSKERGCIYCGAEPVADYSENGKVVWWHPPTDCCGKRRGVQLGPNRRAAAEDTPSNMRSA